MKTGWITQSDAEYFARTEDMNASWLSDIYTWRRMRFPQSITKKSVALLTGTAFHLAVLQPELFRKRVHRFEGDLKSAKNKAAYAEKQELIKDQPEEFILRAADFDLALSMADAVNNDSEAQDILRDCVNEQAGYRKLNLPHMEGMKPPGFAKIKLDARKRGFIIDLKSTTAKNMRELQSAVEDFHYDLKAKYYFKIANGIEEVAKSGISYERFIWIFATKTIPSQCIVYEVSEGDLLIGEHKHMVAYETLKNYYRNGDTNSVLECPEWKWKRYKNLL